MGRFGGVVNKWHRQEPMALGHPVRVRLSGHAMPGGKLGAPPGAANSGNDVYTPLCGPMALGHPGPATHSREGGNPCGD